MFLLCSPGLKFVLDTACEGSLQLFSKVCTRWPQEQVLNNKECCSWCALQWGPLKTYAFFICDLNHGKCMLPLCSGVPAVVSGSQCCQETLCSPSRSGGCPRQAKHFDQLCHVFLFLGCYHHSHHGQIIACEYSRPISKNHYSSMRKMGTSIMVQLFDLTYSSKFLGTHN